MKGWVDMKRFKMKYSVTMILVCLLAGFLLSACGVDDSMVTEIPNSSVKVDMNSGHTYIPAATADSVSDSISDSVSDSGVVDNQSNMIPNSEVQFDRNANHVYLPGPNN